MKSTSPSGNPKEKTVLIVDDDESVLNLLEILVRRDGFKILLAGNGNEALARIEKKPDIILLDLMLPGSTNGFKILQQLEAAQKTEPPILIITAYVNDLEIQQVRTHPCVVEIFPKPINQKKLLDSLHRILKTHPPERASKPVAEIKEKPPEK